MEKLQSRADSDGLYLALKAVMTKNVWKPKQLAEQMIKGPHALKITGGKNDEITVEQLLHFLERKQILHTKAGLSFLLQRCGSSIKAASRSRLPSSQSRLISTYRRRLRSSARGRLCVVGVGRRMRRRAMRRREASASSLARRRTKRERACV